jgi:transposase
VELYKKVRLACAEGMSARAAAKHFNISRGTVEKMLAFSVPPGYRREKPIRRPKLDGFTEFIDAWLEADKAVHRKQRHTAKRIWERLQAEHGFTGGYTIVKDYVRDRERRTQEMFVPLAHPPGQAQADFGEAIVLIGGVEQKAHFFVMDLPHSDAYFVRAYPAATAEAWIDGHVRAFAFFGGVPQSVLYDNDRCLVSKIQPDGTRIRATLFSGLQSHYLFRDRYGRPGKGNDKGAVEGMVG